MGSVGTGKFNQNLNSGLVQGKPGEYTLFRAGTVDKIGGNIIFLTDTKEKAEWYSDTLDEYRPVNEYKIDIKNPLVIDADMDTIALRKAWLTLHPNKTEKDYNNKINGNLTASKWQKLDRENGTALSRSNYDAVIYRKGNNVKEVWIPKKRESEFKDISRIKRMKKYMEERRKQKDNNL